MGFRQAIVPQGTPDGPPELRLHRVASLVEAIRAMTRAAPKKHEHSDRQAVIQLVQANDE